MVTPFASFKKDEESVYLNTPNEMEQQMMHSRKEAFSEFENYHNSMTTFQATMILIIIYAFYKRNFSLFLVFISFFISLMYFTFLYFTYIT